MLRITPWLIAVLFITYVADTHAVEMPLKVYLLAGQSNMQGHAQVRTFEHLGMDARTAPILKEMLNTDGTPRTLKQVWISSIGHDGGESERHGRLMADYGQQGLSPGNINCEPRLNRRRLSLSCHLLIEAVHPRMNISVMD